MIIDSGTTLSFIPREVYEGVEAALKEAIAATPVADAQGRFKLCYEVEGGGGGMNAPAITAHFKGADVVLPQRSSFVEVEEGVVSVGGFGNLGESASD